MEALFGCHRRSGDSMMIKKGVHGNQAGTKRDPSRAARPGLTPSGNPADTKRNQAGTGPALQRQALAGTEPAPSRHRRDSTEPAPSGTEQAQNGSELGTAVHSTSGLRKSGTDD